MGLKLVTKIAAFEKPGRYGVLPSPPVVGERYIAVDADGGLMTLLDRRTLSVVRRRKRALRAVCWSGPEQYVVGSPRAAGVWDCARQEYVWRLPDVGGGYVWRDWVVVGRTASQIELRRLTTGEFERSLDLGADTGGSFCHGYLVCKTPERGDPLRAVDIADGRTVWTRNVLAEMAEQRPDSQPTSPTAITPGSMSDRCVVTRDGITAACSLANGAVLWTADVFVPYYFPLVERGLIPVLASPRFTVIDETSGAILCDRQHPTLRFMYREKSGSILGDLAVFVSESGHVAAFHLQSGDLVYAKQHERVAVWGTAVADGRLLAVATDGKVWVYEAA